MKEIARSFSNKAIQNAIGGFLLFFILIYSTTAESNTVRIFYYALFIIPAFWLYVGLDLRKKYKSFPDQPNYENTTLVKWNRTIEIIFFFLLVISWMLKSRKMFMADFLLGAMFLLYSCWLIYKWRELSKGFSQV